MSYHITHSSMEGFGMYLLEAGSDGSTTTSTLFESMVPLLDTRSGS